MVTLKKYHGLGNDYLIYDPNQNRELLQERQIQLLCRRNTGWEQTVFYLVLCLRMKK